MDYCQILTTHLNNIFLTRLLSEILLYLDVVYAFYFYLLIQCELIHSQL